MVDPVTVMERAGAVNSPSRIARTVPFAWRLPLEVALGGVLAVVSLLSATSGALLTMSPAGPVVTMLFGGVLLTVDLGGRREREDRDPASHTIADHLLRVALLAAALLFLLAGDRSTGAFFGAIGLLHALFTYATRYTTARKQPSSAGATDRGKTPEPAPAREGDPTDSNGVRRYGHRELGLALSGAGSLMAIATDITFGGG